MTRFAKLAIVSAAFGIAALSPTVAFANSGYMTCLLHRPTTDHGGSRTYFTYPFQADSSVEDAMTAKFQAVAIDSGMLNATDQTIGGCHWEATKKQSFAVAKGFLAKYPGNEFDFSHAMEVALSSGR